MTNNLCTPFENELNKVDIQQVEKDIKEKNLKKIYINACQLANAFIQDVNKTSKILGSRS